MAASDLKGKVVIITGGSTGIGEATAIEFAKLGAKLVITGRNLEGLTDTKEKCIKQGLKEQDVTLVTGDICKEETLDLIVKTAVDTFGRVDVLFLSAGKGPTSIGPVTSPESVEGLDYCYQIYIRSPYLLTQKLSAELIKTKGSIIVNVSIAAHWLIPDFSAYSVIKAGEDHMARLFALTFANKGVRVNSVRPGWVRTNVLSEQLPRSPYQPEAMSALDALTPLGSTLTTSEEIARVVVFLASSQSACMTGVQITCDKGFSMTHPAVDWKQF